MTDAFGRLRGRQAVDLWLGGAQPHSFRRGLFTLDVADANKKAAIDGRYREDLESIFRDITGSPVRLRTRIVDDALADAEEPDVPAPAIDRPAIARPARGRSPDPVAPTRPYGFAVTPANELAHRAVQQLIDERTPSFRPLFVHGPAGSGKTALARWALQRLRAADPDADPLVLSGDSLARDVSRAAHTRRFGEMQRDWSGRHVIVLDEAHRLRGKSTAQAMAASLVGPALDREGRVLVLSRHPPHEIHALGDRLRSLFVGGMVVALGAPGEADRAAVLTEIASALPVEVAPEVPLAVAARCPGTLTDAVELLEREAARARGEGRPLQLAHLAERLARPSTGEVTLDTLVAMLSGETGIESDRIRSPEKSRDVAAARHLCVYLAAHSLGLSSRQICRSLRLRSPSIVAYARRAVERKRHIDPSFERLVHVLQARVAGAQRDLQW